MERVEAVRRPSFASPLAPTLAPGRHTHALQRLADRSAQVAASRALQGLAAPVHAPLAPPLPARAAVQRVGGEKIGFTFVSDQSSPVVQEGMVKLAELWSAFRRQRHDTKMRELGEVVDMGGKLEMKRRLLRERDQLLRNRGFDPNTATRGQKRQAQRDVVAGHGLTGDPFASLEAEQGGGFTSYYATKLTKHQGQAQQLRDLIARHGDHFAIDGDDVSYRMAETDAFTRIATLKHGDEAFAEQPVSPDEGLVRKLYGKQGIVDSHTSTDPKTYVKDTRGVMTRRYAYVEKNYYQMMEFFMTHQMEGRFQALMRAAGEPNPDIFEHRDEGVDLVRGQTAAPSTAPLTLEQMAVAHQKLGSGPQQRGVSLTSTPKVNATFVNTGENFRTRDTPGGFRLKVDLALVPADVPFVNHYAKRGVREATTPGGAAAYDKHRARTGTGEYPYEDSALHARELFLEQLDPSWIVEIEFHDQGNVTGTGAGSATVAKGATPTDAFVASAASSFGGDDYTTGFDLGLKQNFLTATQRRNAHLARGFDGARLFVAGWHEGKQDYRQANPNADSLGPHKDREQAQAQGLTLPQYVVDQTLSKPAHEDKFDLFRYGYLHGRRGKPLIEAHGQLPAVTMR